MRLFYKLKALSILSLFLFCLPLGVSTALAESIPNSAMETKVLSEETEIPKLNLLKTIEGVKFNLNKAISEKPTVLVFYRGGWCPYCNAQLGKLNSIEPKLLDMGFQIIAISPDKPENLKESIKKNEIKYLLLSDSKMEVAKDFGVAFKLDDFTVLKYNIFGVNLKKASGQDHKLLPVPSVFIIDTKGVIKFKHSNPDFKVRLDSETILEKAESLIKNKP